MTAVVAGAAGAQIDRDMDFVMVRRAVEQSAEELPAIEARWREGLRPETAADQSWAELFGYAPPGRAVQLGGLHAFLYSVQQRPADALAAAAYLVRMANYRDEVPARQKEQRIEYAGGLPAVPSFFHLADYAAAWRQIRECAEIDDASRQIVEAAIAGSADFVLVFPEWGAHNRAMLRAESLLQAALALPAHAEARRWRKMAEILAADSLGQWEIEDAQIYHPIWLLALLRYADAAGDPSIPRSIPVRYYLRYFSELLSPRGTIPDFGDAWWNASLARYYTCLEWGASALGDPELRWAAARVYHALGPFDRARPGLQRALIFAQLFGKVDPALAGVEPPSRSGPVLDDVIGKKLVFRTGRGADDLYLLLNYRDYGLRDRDYLRQTLAVVEEKMHHGHADENAIVLLMDRGSVLLHDAGYRDMAPSGPFGAYRADLFHNRLVVRRGEPAAGQSVLELLRDSGAYRPVRTQLLDFARFELGDYGRTRVIDTERGYTWDRTIVAPAGLRLFVVFDTVRIDRAGHATLSTLWATRHVEHLGERRAVTSIDRIGNDVLPQSRHLLLLFPGATPTTPGRFPLRRHTQDEQVLHETQTRRFDAGAWATFVTVLWSVPPDGDHEAAAAAVRRLPSEPAGRTVGVQIETGGDTWTIGCKADLALGVRAADVRPRYDPGAGRARYESVASDGDLVVMRRRGEAVRWAATNMTHVDVGERRVFEARPFQVFQTSGKSDVVGRSKWRRWEGELRAK